MINKCVNEFDTILSLNCENLSLEGDLVCKTKGLRVLQIGRFARFGNILHKEIKSTMLLIFFGNFILIKFQT